MAKIDRRTFTRYKVQVNAIATTPKRSYSIEIIELSLVGAKIRSLQAINPGTKVTICVELQNKILFQGKVVWVLGTLKKHLQSYMIGIETDAMELSDTKAIGLTERTDLLQEILFNIKEKAVCAVV